MAYMSQENKRQIATNLKRVMPKGWKYSLSVRHHSTLVLTISECPINLIAEYAARAKERKPDTHLTGNETHITVNPYWLSDQFVGERHHQFKAIFDVLNEGNFDKSDIQTDYFHVGWYSEVRLGRWDRPFKVAA